MNAAGHKSVTSHAVPPRILRSEAAPAVKPLRGLKLLGAAELETNILLPRKSVTKLKVMCVAVPESGHLLPAVQVSIALAERRHQVQLVSCAAVGSKIVSMCGRSGVVFKGVAHDVKLAESCQGKAAELMDQGLVVSMYMHYNNMMYKPCRDLVERTTPDVIVADFATPCAFRVAEETGVPLIVNLPGPLMLRKLFTPLRGMPFLTREQWKMSKLMSEVQEQVQKRPCLWHTFVGMEDPQPLPPNITLIGSPAPPSAVSAGQVDTPCEEFNKWIRWVREERLQVVYVTMGSMQILTQQQVRSFYEGLQRIPNIGVAWSLKAAQQVHLPGGGLDGLPRKFFIRNWMPQAEALHIPEVVVVLSHCGWGGVMDTVCAGKAMVSAPFRADQPMNASILQRQGVSVTLDTKRLTADAVEESVSRVLRDPSFRQNAKRMQAQLLRAGGRERCAEAVEAFAANGFEVLASEPMTLRRELQPVAMRVGYSILGAAVVCVAPRAIPLVRHVLGRVLQGVLAGGLLRAALRGALPRMCD